nr:hypothetical protein [Candidatus Njordarchaeum guaymaensis]
MEIKKDTIVHHHELRRNWSVFLRYFIGDANKTMIGTSPEVELSESQVVFRFRELGNTEYPWF